MREWTAETDRVAFSIMRYLPSVEVALSPFATPTPAKINQKIRED